MERELTTKRFPEPLQTLEFSYNQQAQLTATFSKMIEPIARIQAESAVIEPSLSFKPLVSNSHCQLCCQQVDQKTRGA